jgi:hypothetical protein
MLVRTSMCPVIRERSMRGTSRKLVANFTIRTALLPISATPASSNRLDGSRSEYINVPCRESNLASSHLLYRIIKGYRFVRNPGHEQSFRTVQAAPREGHGWEVITSASDSMHPEFWSRPRDRKLPDCFPSLSSTPWRHCLPFPLVLPFDATGL